MRPILISTAALALAGLGCGGGDEKSPSSSPATTTPQTVTPPPAELLGTYTTTLKPTDVPDPAPPCRASYTWKAEGESLRLTAVKHGCADKVAKTILSAEPWKRSG
jgi:hypothetical protein